MLFTLIAALVLAASPNSAPSASPRPAKTKARRAATQPRVERPAPATPASATVPPAAPPTLESAPAVQASPAKLSIVVLELAAKEVRRDVAELVTESVLQEVHKLEGVRAISMADVKAALTFDKQRQLLSCDEGSCLQELSGMLGADRVVAGTLGKMGDSWLLTLKLMNMRSGRMENQVSERVVGGRADVLLDMVGPLVEKLLPAQPLKAGQARGVEPTLRERAEAYRSQPNRLWAYVAGGAAVACLGGGVAMGLASKSANDDRQALLGRAQTEPVSAADLSSLEESSNSRALTANILFGVAGAAAATSVVLFLLSSGPAEEPAESSPPAAVGLAPVAGGLLLTVGGAY